MKLCYPRILVSWILIHITVSAAYATDLAVIEYLKPQQKNITVNKKLDTVKVTEFSKPVMLGTLTNKSTMSYKFDTPANTLDSYISSLLTENLQIRKDIYEQFFGEILPDDKANSSLQGEELIKYRKSTKYVLTKRLDTKKSSIYYIEIRNRSTNQMQGLLAFPLKIKNSKWVFDKANRNLGVFYLSYPFTDKVITNSKQVHPFTEIPSAAKRFYIDCEIN